MRHKDRLSALEREQNYQLWLATSEFFKGRSSDELLFFALFGWFLRDDPDVAREKRLLEFRFPNYHMVVELIESTRHDYLA